MILLSYYRQASTGAHLPPAYPGSDAQQDSPHPGKDRDEPDGFETVLEALTAAFGAVERPSSDRAGQDGDETTSAGGNKGMAPLAGTGAAGELVSGALDEAFELAAGGVESAKHFAETEASAALAAQKTGAAMPEGDVKALERNRGGTKTLATDPTGSPREGDDGAEIRRADFPQSPRSDPTLRVTVRGGMEVSSEIAPGTDVLKAERRGVSNDTPDAGIADDRGNTIDAGSDLPDAQGSTTDPSARQKPAGSEDGGPLAAPHRSLADPGSDAGPPPGPAGQPSRHEPLVATVARLAQQMAEAAHQTGKGTVEVALSPEELGQVRLTIHSHDGGTASVHLGADRQETLDLMRRHVELLAQDMRELGYSDLSFSFQDRVQRGPQNSAEGDRSSQTSDMSGVDSGPVIPAFASTPVADGGLDIRI